MADAKRTSEEAYNKEPPYGCRICALSDGTQGRYSCAIVLVTLFMLPVLLRRFSAVSILNVAVFFLENF